jgi:hypothetical protein
MSETKCCGVRECTQEEWDAMVAEIDTEKARRAAQMPDDAAALKQLFEAWLRLQELGWRDARNAPKDATLQFIEIGSTGIHTGHRDEKSESGLCWLHDNGDLWPSRPILFRPHPTEAKE